ncbi:apolipoprotein N-acyltransferase [Paraglaciecola sp. L3A3]|uniref:apolipoprotein N-acyltransferase n=1 Tax=Paraglaciecola sp. L3A3 TaxID=2686358 RepID=UPI00131BB6D4|nr:apolipoprotein N-acyltransferase [Paraglaciecola sp. L3A3]
MKTLPTNLKCLLACISGALLTFAYAPFSFWFVLFLCLPFFIYLLANTEKKHAFKLGFCFGLGWFGAGISWVHVSIADFGGIPLIASLGLMLLLSAYLALYPALACFVLHRYFKQNYWPLAFPFIWLVVEWLRSVLFTGFPWLSLGYSQISSPLSGWLPVIGEFGTTGLIILISSAWALTIRDKKWLHSLALTLVIFVSGYSLNQYQWAIPSGKEAQIAMVQGNIQQELRWAPEHDQPTMDKYRNMTDALWLKNDVVIWPEAAVPQLETVAKKYLLALDIVAAETQTGLITGIVDYNFKTREAYNYLIGLGLKEANSEKSTETKGQYFYNHSNRFAKHHLLPIGEFIPFENWLRTVAPIFDLPMSSFSRGDYQQSNIKANGFNFAPAICFEIAFPEQISSNLYFNTDFIITVSNDAWFGASHGPAQHLEIAQVRAKEFALPVLRATNNGITAFINHKGEIQSRLPQFEAAALSDSIQLVQGNTPFRNFANWPAWIVSFTLFCLAMLRRKK